MRISKNTLNCQPKQYYMLNQKPFKPSNIATMMCAGYLGGYHGMLNIVPCTVNAIKSHTLKQSLPSLVKMTGKALLFSCIGALIGQGIDCLIDKIRIQKRIKQTEKFFQTQI